MVKKSLLSLAIAASVAGLTGCQISSVENNNQVDSNPVTAGQPGSTPARVAPIFSAANAQLPLNIDLLFADAGSTDGTANVGEPSNAVTQGINQLPGFSTTAAFYIPFNAALDPATVAAGSSVFLVKLKNADDDASIDPLDLKSIIAAFPTSPVADGQTDQNQAAFDADYVEMTDGTHAIRIMPNEPLEPRTKYIAVVTDAVKGANGEATGPSAEYELLSGNLGLPSSALAPVRTAVQGWEQIAGGFLAQATDGVYTQDNVILSYAFTTNSDAYGLRQYAAPGLFLKAQLPLASAEALLDGETAGSTTNLVAGGVIQAFIAASVPGFDNPADATQIAAAKQTPQYEAAIYNTILDLDTELGLPENVTINSTIGAPEARAVNLVNQTVVDGGVNSQPVITDQGASPQSLAILAAAAAAEAATIAQLAETDPDATQGEIDAAVATAVGQAVTAATAAVPDAATRYIQGQIELPNFLALPEKPSALTPEAIAQSLADDKPWSANLALGAILDGALGNPAGTTPPKDCTDPQPTGEVDENKEPIVNCSQATDATTNVTWRYPFPQKDTVATNYAPLLITKPAAFDYTGGGAAPQYSDCTQTGGGQAFENGYPVVIYVHGITTHRAASSQFGAALAPNCVVTVAIDLPLHGIAPTTSDSNGNIIDNSALLFSMDPSKATLTSSPWAGVAAASAGEGQTFENLAERHGNIHQNSMNIRQDMVFKGQDVGGTPAETAVGSSGSAFINVANFARSRDNMQQGVVDLLNLNASLVNIETELGINLDLDKVYVAGHSLGAIFATTFAAVNNDAEVQQYNSNLNEIKGVILANGGSHVAKLLENSPSFGPTIIGGLKAAADLDQGSSAFESFMHVIQATIDVVDPANSAKALADSGTPVLLFNAVGGGELPAVGSRDGISLPDAFKGDAISNYLPDAVVPNYDYFAAQATNPFAGFVNPFCFNSTDENCAGLAFPADSAVTARAPMAGTNGLANIMGLDVVRKDTTASEVESPVQVQVRLSKATHSTFGNGDVSAAFSEMMTQATLLIKGAYQSDVANTLDSDVLEAASN